MLSIPFSGAGNVRIFASQYVYVDINVYLDSKDDGKRRQMSPNAKLHFYFIIMTSIWQTDPGCRSISINPLCANITQDFLIHHGGFQ